MMMEKPRPKVEEEKAAPIKKKSAEEAVAELEQRLAALGGPSPAAVVAEAPVTVQAQSPVAPPAVPPAVEQPKEVKGGKNALLARIMAAQEKTKAAAAPPQADVRGPPPGIQTVAAAPPAYNAGLFVPPVTEQQPPAFDFIEDDVMAQMDEVAPPSYLEPPSYLVAPSPAASAPAFEDLLGVQEPPPPQYVAPEEEIIMGMEGLSPEERSALMDEQRKIMEQIDREKVANKSAIAAGQADNFDMRSTANALNAVGSRAPTMRPPARAVAASKVNVGGGQEVDLHGPERTKEAIKDGTAILVQCVNCENWMQVTGNATLMYCPVCAVVSPVDQSNAAMSKEEAMQMEADHKMAEQLQSEEYEAAEQPPRRQRHAQASDAAPAALPAQPEESWWGTVAGMFSSETKETAPPPVQSSRSGDERESLTGGGGGGRPAARVAERQPLFSCVVDSVNSTVGTLTGTHLGHDKEGNVHGVDATSLLAVSNIGRDTEYQQFNNN